MSLGDDMAAPYSGDLRQRVAAAVAQGASARSAAGRFGVSVSTAIRWACRWRAEGHAAPRSDGGRSPFAPAGAPIGSIGVAGPAAGPDLAGAARRTDDGARD